MPFGTKRELYCVSAVRGSSLEEVNRLKRRMGLKMYIEQV
jgi:hypothetical protein